MAPGVVATSFSRPCPIRRSIRIAGRASNQAKTKPKRVRGGLKKKNDWQNCSSSFLISQVRFLRDGSRLGAIAHTNGHTEGSRSSSKTTEVSFNLSSYVETSIGEGDQVMLVGQTKELGCWDVRRGVPFTENDGREEKPFPTKKRWTAKVDLHAGERVEFKCVVAGPRGDRWEEGENRSVVVPRTLGGKPLSINLIWPGEMQQEAQGEAQTTNTRTREDLSDSFDDTLDKLKSTLDKIEEKFDSSPSVGEAEKEQEEATRATMAGGKDQTSEDSSSMPATSQEITTNLNPNESDFGLELEMEMMDTDLAATNSWQGKEVVFMQSNDHSHERQGMVWDTSGLAEGSYEMQIVKGDQESPSWREKLEVVERLLCKGTESKELDSEAVSASAIYSSWINCGAIACSEGGGHHRPCRHAESSMRMFRALEWGLEESTRKAGSGSFTSVLIRRLFPLLPSFSSQFRASVPLTRIRDIAHRNDIPQDLKREIKHTIQNKLHRNAGPEDLVATEQMLRRISGEDRDQDYSEAFVEEFKVFTVELREFFNASSLDDQLLELEQAMGEEEKEKIRRFLRAKEATSSSSQTDSTLEDLLFLMGETTAIRQLLYRALSSGLRNDAPEEALEVRQKYRLCEIALETFAFTVASRAINAFGDGHGSALDKVSKLVLVLHNCMLNLSFDGYLQTECSAVSNELVACADLMSGGAESLDDNTTKLCMLRLKACLDRTKRVCNSYRDSYLQTYSDQAVRLGKALGPAIPDHTMKMHAESETRASLVFQCAKLGQLLSRSVNRDFLKDGNHEWETLVAGEAFGKLLLFDSIEEHTLQNGSDKEDKILLVRKATGDEEVSASGEGVRGVILMHELPHLSHLAIRSRQEQVIFATCTSEEEINNLVDSLVGKYVRIQASQQDVVVTESEMPGAPEIEDKNMQKSEIETDEREIDFSSVQVKKADFLSSVGMLGSTRETCGAKAALCGELRKLSNSIRAGEVDVEAMDALDFSVPNGVCLPFGTMELVLGMQGGDATREWEESLSYLDSLLKSNSSGQELDAASERLREQIESLEIPSSFVEQSVCSHFDSSDSVVARSSANVEDLKGMSGAGLYDSVLHLKVSDPSSVAEGIKKVWASLYTRRAILSRHKAGIQSQSAACMAVLVQKMIPSEYSFVLHTSDPILEEGRDMFVYAEVALGLGETLASGKQGTPYRMRIQKDSLQVEILSFANFSSTEAGAEEVDYSQLRLTKDPQALVDLGTQLCKLGIHLERHFGDPQDIEGALCRDSAGDQFYIVQSRPQF